MNRFIIEDTPDAIARSLCDQHIVKMPLEEAQMMCTAVWELEPRWAEKYGLYKPVHKKHPCTLWVMKSSGNFAFAFALYDAMLKEYTFRYGREHGAGKHRKVLKSLRFIAPLIPTTREPVFPQKDPLSPYTGLTAHPQCFSGHDDCKTDEDWPIVAYRAFYTIDKSRFARYNKGRDKPFWMKKPLVLHVGE